MLKTIFRFSWIIAVLLSACHQSDDGSQQVTLSPEPGTIDYNGTFTMSWSATAVDYCIASGDWSGNIKSSGSKTLGPLTRDSFFIIDCYYSGKVISDSVSVKVRAPQIPEVNLSASPLSIAFQGATTITWSARHVTDCLAEGDWSGAKNPVGSVTMEGLQTNSEFRLICRGPHGEVTDSVRVTVGEAGIKVPRVKLTATPAKVSYNGSTTLAWDSQDADICRASGDWFGSKSVSGTKTIKQLTTDSRYILTCTIAGSGDGGEGIDAAEVSVDPVPAPKVTLTASPLEVITDGAVTLRWSSSHADSCIAIGDWSGTKSISGAKTVSGLKKNRLFTLKCIGIGGLGTASIKVTVIDKDS